jgi:hypothetical protein
MKSLDFPDLHSLQPVNSIKIQVILLYCMESFEIWKF